jgi:alkaline phosphatase
VTSRLSSAGRAAAAAGVALGVAFALIPAPQAAAAVPTAKNIIVLISDGAGYNQFDIASLYETGHTLNQVSVDPVTGEVEHYPGTPTQVYETYPVQVAQSHYSANQRARYDDDDAWGAFNWVYDGATDSAAAATALGTGVKTNNGVLGHTPQQERLLTIVDHAEALGKATGTVTSVEFNHATPAGFVAHNADRNDYHGLATEMIDSGLDVIMGAGHPLFTNDHAARTPRYEWISEADFTRVSAGQTPYSYIETAADFEALAAAGDAAPNQVFGLVQSAETLQCYRAGRNEHKNVLPGTDPFTEGVPTLATMAKGALNVLAKNDNGFFLMIEGGAIDWASHDNSTTRLIEEQMDFNGAVAAVDAWIEANSSWDETLVIITADHETGYLSGPGADPAWTPMTGQAGQLPNVSWHSGNHTNSLVPLFAKGIGSDLLAARAVNWDKVRGPYLDNTDIGKILFDLLGYGYSGATSTVPLEAAIGMAPPALGNLTLRVAPVAEPVAFTLTGDVMTASLPTVTVNDTRTDVQAQSGGWAVSGRAEDFTAGNRVISAEGLNWTPAITSTQGGATAGPAVNLKEPTRLADATAATRQGATVVTAGLTLTLPDRVDYGRYGSEIVLTLFATD